LEQKAHETVLEINLNAIAHNLKVYQSLLKPGTKCMAMVKALSYGSGSFEIANVLQFNRVDYLAVAYADEGVELRKAGITLPVMVMNPELNGLETFLKYKLEPEIYSIRLLEEFEQAVKRYQGGAVELPFPIHIKLETGMHRLGFEKKDIDKLIQKMKKNKLLKIASIFSHLAASDNAEHDAFTRSQITQFIGLSHSIESRLNIGIQKHILNSAGTVRFADAQMDMVRLGLGLYGIDTTGEFQPKLNNVSTLKTTISQIKKVAAGETIGYNRNAKAKKAMKIAVISIGYADGLNRKLGNGKGKMLVKGQLVPIIGDICMDMAMLDITNSGKGTVPLVQEGDEVIVFGDELPVTTLARWADSIPYQIITNISKRVKRVYYQE